MYSVLIVDDEKLELETLTHFVDWKSMGYKVIGTAKNGEEAFQKIERLQPDVVITDIKMPIMDGLELIKLLNTRFPQIHTVILSGYDEFSYAKKAIEYGVAGYLLKPIELEELEIILEKMYQICERQKQSVQQDYVMKEKYLKELIMEKSKNHKDNIIKKFSSLAPHYTNNKMETFLMVGVKLDSKETKTQQVSLTKAVQNYLLNNTNSGVSITYGYETFILINQSSDFQINLLNFTKHLFQHLKDQYDSSIAVACSSKKIFLEDIDRLFNDITAMLEDTFYYGFNRIITSEMLNYHIPGKHNNVSLYKLRETIITDLKHSDYHSTIKRVKELFMFLSNNRTEKEKVYEHSSELIKLIFDHLPENQKPLINITKFLSDIYSQRTIDEILNKVIKFIDSLSGTDQQLELNLNVHRAKDITRFLETNFQRDVTIDEIAEQLYLTPNYVRAIFKQYSGKTINEYLTTIRINKAAELLKENKYKVNQIANQVGYNHVSYFCSIFSKYKGVTPKKYRMLANRVDK